MATIAFDEEDTMKHRNLIAALALAATAALPQIATAATAKLEWKDLDLSSEAGRTELDRRVDAAAIRACTFEPNTGSRVAKAPKASCVSDAKSQIMSKLAARLPENPALASAGGATQTR